MSPVRVSKCTDMPAVYSGSSLASTAALGVSSASRQDDPLLGAALVIKVAGHGPGLIRHPSQHADRTLSSK